MDSQKDLYLGDEPAVVFGPTSTDVWPLLPPGLDFAQRSVCQVVVSQEGEDRPLFGQAIGFDTLTETTMSRYQGIDPGNLQHLHGPQVPVSALHPLRRFLPNRAGGRLIGFQVADLVEKQPIDAGPYEVIVVLEHLDRCPELEALNDPRLAERIYNDALEANQWHLRLDIEKYRADAHYSVIDRTSKPQSNG